MTKRNHYGHKVTPQVNRQKQKEVKKKQVLRKKIITGFKHYVLDLWNVLRFLV